MKQQGHFTIKQILTDHWQPFIDTHSNVRPVVVKEVQKVLECGDPSKGYALYICDKCGAYKFVPFRCHSRFCNTCGQAYQSDRADNIARKLINVKHRHIVFTIPEELRIYFRKDRSLLNILFQSSAQVIHDHFYNQNKQEKFTAGMVCGLHTFGRDLKWNPHIHMLITEGVSGKNTVWKNIKFFSFTMLRKRWQTTLLHNLREALNPKIFDLDTYNQLVNYLYKTKDNGFYVNAPKKDDFNSPMAVANYITRYIGRPAMAQSRITGYDGTNVTYWYQRHEDNQKITVTEHAFKFIERLIIHIPETGFNMLRYYGLYAKPFAKTSNLIRISRNRSSTYWKIKKLWAFRMSATFNKDPLNCPCGGSFKFNDIFTFRSKTHSPPNVIKSKYQPA